MSHEDANDDGGIYYRAAFDQQRRILFIFCRFAAVGGVQSQTMTVDRQMRRYSVPRVAFINKCDRSGADPYKVPIRRVTASDARQSLSASFVQVLSQIKEKLRLSCAFTTLPIGLEDKLSGLVDIVNMRAIYFEGKTPILPACQRSPLFLPSRIRRNGQQLALR